MALSPADIVGTWRMVGYHNRTADGQELQQTYGPEPIGLIRFDAHGRMVVVIADGRLDLPDGIVTRPFTAYTGRWSFDGRTLANTVDESFIRDFVGTTQVREARYENGRLSLVPPPIVIDGVINHRELIWEKIPGP
jgi:hypothetical protein